MTIEETLEQEMAQEMTALFQRSVQARAHIKGSVPMKFEVTTEERTIGGTTPLLLPPKRDTQPPQEDPKPPVPRVDSVTPNTGPAAGSTSVAIRGDGFLPVARVKFGGTLELPGGTYTSPQRIDAVTPPHSPGLVDVDVINLDGPPEVKGTLVDGYGYDTPVIVVTDRYGDQGGGKTVTISNGFGFVSGTTVKFGGVDATAITIVNSTTLTCVTPAHAPGIVPVVVRNPDGLTMTLSNGFNYTHTYPAIFWPEQPAPTHFGNGTIHFPRYQHYETVFVGGGTLYGTYEGLLRVRAHLINIIGSGGPTMEVQVNGVNVLGFTGVDIPTVGGLTQFQVRPVFTAGFVTSASFFLIVQDVAYPTIPCDNNGVAWDYP